MFLLVCMTGCSHFICREYDSGLKKTGKVSARVLTGICTFGITEAAIYDTKSKEDREKLARKRAEFWASFWARYAEAEPDEKEMMRLQLQWMQMEEAAAIQRSMAASDALRAWSAWRASSPYSNRPVIFAPSY